MKVYCKIRNCIISNFLWSCDHRKGFIAQQIFIFLFENEESRLKILASEKSYSWTNIAIIKHYLLIAELQTYHFNKSSAKRLHSFSSPFLPNISWSCWTPHPRNIRKPRFYDVIRGSKKDTLWKNRLKADFKNSD